MGNLQKDFVPYELALRMKVLEFKESGCFGYWVIGGEEPKRIHVNEYTIGDWNSHPSRISAPLYSQAFRWFREKHKLDCGIDVYSEMDFKTEEIIKKYTGRVDNWNTIWSIHDGTGLMMPEHYHFEASSYEEVELSCLEKLLEIVEENL
jgi:sucrose-6-phosphate hydrolase SacC (GH32 family)